VLKYAGYKEKLCFRWSQGGSCVLGDACGFAHGEHELRGAARSGGQAGAWGNAAASASANVFRPSYDPPYASVDLDWESPQHGYSGYLCVLAAFPPASFPCDTFEMIPCDSVSEEEDTYIPG